MGDIFYHKMLKRFHKNSGGILILGLPMENIKIGTRT